MTSRELIKRIINREEVPRAGFWMGHPTKDTWPILLDYFKVETQAEVRDILGDDILWHAAGNNYNSPIGTIAFPNPRKGDGLACEGIFSDCETIEEIENYPWPEEKYIDFTEDIEIMKNAKDKYRLSGMWSPFFHKVADLFGMEEYFMKMYTNPEIVHAVTSRVVNYYLAGTERFFQEAGDEVDGFFFGNDFGSQLDILVSPECFEEFIFPYFKQLTELAHKYNKQVVLHSCGAITKVIPKLIDLGVDCLHPLQAKAQHMEPENLNQFAGKITLFGNIDTQDLLVNGTVEEVVESVKRSKKNLAPYYIVSPSHEAVLPNVPPVLLEAMAIEAHKPY